MATAVKPPPSAPADTPLGQLQMLCDPGTFRPLRSGVSSTRLGERATPGDGVAAGAGEVDGRPVFCYAQDPAFLGGSLGEVHADTIVRTMRMAGDAGAPVVGFVRSRGAAGGGFRPPRRPPPAGGPRRPRRLRPHLPGQRRALAQGAADLDPLRR